jgi:CBS domain-containing protein
LISESLSPFARRVILAGAADTVVSAARKLRDARVGCIVVVGSGQVIGILTDRDIALRVVAEGLDAEHTSVEQIMTRDPVLLDASATLESAVSLMQKHGIRRLPIVNDSKLLLGILTADDLVAQLGRQLAAMAGMIAEPSDSDDSR